MKKLNDKNQRISMGNFKSIMTTGLLAFLLSFISFGALSAETMNDDVDNTRAILEKWVETRRIISQEQHDFAISKEMFDERIKLTENEIKSLKVKIKEAEDSITATDKKRGELIDENGKLKGASASLAGITNALEKRTKSLLKQIPDSIHERVKPLSQRFPDNSKETKLSLGERFQNIVGVLNEINKFNGEMTVVSEVLNLPGGSSAEVTALYMGIGQGYYVNGDGSLAGIGTASPQGWSWTPANESATEIGDAIAILKNEKIASFVRLPIEIK